MKAKGQMLKAEVAAFQPSAFILQLCSRLPAFFDRAFKGEL